MEFLTIFTFNWIDRLLATSFLIKNDNID